MISERDIVLQSLNAFTRSGTDQPYVSVDGYDGYSRDQHYDEDGIYFPLPDYYRADRDMRHKVGEVEIPGYREVLSIRKLHEIKELLGLQLTVMVNSYQEEDSIERTLNDLLRLRGFLDSIIVTDISYDRTPHIVSEFEENFPDFIKLLRPREILHKLGVDYFQKGKGANYAVTSYVLDDPEQVVISVDSDYVGFKAAQVQGVASPLIAENGLHGGQIMVSRAILKRTTQQGDSEGQVKVSGERATKLTFVPLAQELHGLKAPVTPLAGLYGFLPHAFNERTKRDDVGIPVHYNIETFFNNRFDAETETAQVWAGRWHQVGQSTDSLRNMSLQIVYEQLYEAQRRGLLSPDFQFPAHALLWNIEDGEDGVPVITGKEFPIDVRRLPHLGQVVEQPGNQAVLDELRDYVYNGGDQPDWYNY